MQNSPWGELGAQIDERDRSSTDKNDKSTKSKTENEVVETIDEKLDEKSINWDELGTQLDQLDGTSSTNGDKNVKKELNKENVDDLISHSKSIIPKKESKNNSTEENLDERSNFNVNTSKMGFQNFRIRDFSKK